ncbi:MAG: hypothetical protein SW833_20650 [Cyanobacteriota bacterium]|nr:hypothetical protein [Cyanobacteriota bacterium]
MSLWIPENLNNVKLWDRSPKLLKWRSRNSTNPPIALYRLQLWPVVGGTNSPPG